MDHVISRKQGRTELSYLHDQRWQLPAKYTEDEAVLTAAEYAHINALSQKGTTQEEIRCITGHAPATIRKVSENQITHFYSEKKNTAEMLKLLEILLAKYADQTCIYFSWDAASWHASKKFNRRVDEINSSEFRATHAGPRVTLAPLPACAQFLNVIESVFSGMARAVIHCSDYPSTAVCMEAIDRHFIERNQYFRAHPKRAGKKLWGKELVPATFDEANNCKDPRWR